LENFSSSGTFGLKNLFGLKTYVLLGSSFVNKISSTYGPGKIDKG